MKRKIVLLFILGLLIIFANLFPNISLQASTDALDPSLFEDQDFYQCLLQLSKSDTLTKDSLENIAVDLVDISDPGKGFILDLSFKTVNKNSSTTGTSYTFTSIKGIEYLFNSLDPNYKIAQINLSGHNISTVGDHLKYCKDLEVLDLSDNNISNLDISTLSKVKTLYLVNNNFSSLDDIKLFEFDNNSSEIFTRNIYLSYNNILGEDLNKSNSTIVYNLGVQGVKFNSKFYTTATIGFKSYVSGITKINITKIDEINTNSVSVVPYQNELGEIQNQITLSYGKYRIEFPEIESVDNLEHTYLNSIDFEVKVSSPNIKMIQNDKEITLQKYLYEITTLSFIGEGEIHIIINDEDIKADSYTIKQAGLQTIGYYQIINGYTSDIEYFTVNSKVNSSLQFLYILLTFAGFTALIFVFYFLYKNVYLKKMFNNSNKKEKF